MLIHVFTVHLLSPPFFFFLFLSKLTCGNFHHSAPSTSFKFITWKWCSCCSMFNFHTSTEHSPSTFYQHENYFRILSEISSRFTAFFFSYPLNYYDDFVSFRYVIQLMRHNVWHVRRVQYPIDTNNIVKIFLNSI